MDANRARFHALWGHAGDWDAVLKAAAGAGVPDAEAADGALRLRAQTPTFRNVSTIALAPDARRGAARDRYGNWYWIGPSGREVLVQSSGTGAGSSFWPLLAAARPGPFAPVAPAPPAGRLAGLAVTRHHALVAGTLDPPGLLAFDLAAGGPPRRVAAPAGAPFTPFDLAALGDGVVVLDRDHRAAWAFDRDLVPRPVAAPAEAPDTFQPVAAASPRRARDASAPTAAVSLPAGWPAPLAVEAVSCDAALVLHEAVSNTPAGTMPKVASEGSLLAKVDWSGPLPLASAPALGTKAASELKLTVQGQVVAGHDFALAPNPPETAGVATPPPKYRLEVALANGTQAVAFALANLKEAADFIPLRRFGGLGYVGAAPGDDGTRPGYDSAGTWVTAEVMPRPRFAPAATLLLPGPDGWDGKAAQCVWHRVFLDACVPPGCSIRLVAEVSDDRATWHAAGSQATGTAVTYLQPVARDAGVLLELPPALKDLVARATARNETAWWQPDPRRRADGCELPFAPAPPAGFATWETLFHGAKGRYLRLTVELTGDGTRSPRVRAVRAWYPRFSYVEHYLPAIYRDDATSADFLERFLANAEGTLTGIEDRIVAARALVDPRTAPAEALDWLTGWLGLEASPAWDAPRKRAFLRHAPDILRRRGTIRGLQWALHLALDKCLDEGIFADPRTDTSPYRIVESFRRRAATAVALGDPTGLDLPRQAAPAAGTSGRWLPGSSTDDLNRRYAEKIEQPGAAFPLCPPPEADKAAVWAAFARATLGFVPQALPGNPDHEARWAAFLHRRYRTDSPPGGPLPLTLGVRPNTAADWYAFETVVMAALATAHRFEVLIPTVADGVRLTASPSPADLEESRRRRELARQVVRREAPAHCAFEVRLYASAFRVGGSRVGADTLLGLGSRAPDLYDEMILDAAFLGEAFLHARPPLDAPGLTVLGQTPTFRARAARGASTR